MIQERYRADYTGEFVITETKWAAGKKTQTREWVPNPIENHHISGRAACIGSRTDLDQFDYKKLQRHRGGLLGSKKLQTYGVGTICQDLNLDFAVETNVAGLASIKESGYQKTNIVYTSSRNCILNPGNFYLIPYAPKIIDIATIVYLAAFDGHKEVFLLGYNKDTSATVKNWEIYVKKIFDCYPGVKFLIVGEKTNMFDCWLECYNTNAITYREFISYADI